MNEFEQFFSSISHFDRPRDWQSALAAEVRCSNRMIRIPTGFGKTLGVLSAWMYHRVINANNDWPRRLVWCLPMRVLVEQTRDEVERALAALDLLWQGDDHAGKVGVHVLMGGVNSGDWHLYPEECAVLIGTQDMLLSRALNRGYASPRARWPMEFGLLNQDCLWIMDEVQLMDVGLSTSAQLQAFRGDDYIAEKCFQPCFSWWMSATLQPNWLQKSPDTKELTYQMPETRIKAASRLGHLWDDVAKPCTVELLANPAALAKLVADKHEELGSGAAGPTVVVVNTVKAAIEVFDALQKELTRFGDLFAETDLRLIHSRFRPAERANWSHEFLNKSACGPNTNRIIIATQVIEAGVDLSAALLITEMAPWASLVQRFGRSARWGGKSQVIVADFGYSGDKALPYTENELQAARNALSHLADVAPLYLEEFEEKYSELLTELYPYEPNQLLLRHEIDELFDTNPDLTGSDIDVSRFIRSGVERDLHVFWAEVEPKVAPLAAIKPLREALCAVPFLAAREWLCGKESGNTKQPRLKKGMRAWVWVWLEGEWRDAERRDLYPGQTVLVAAECGGYDPKRGWWPESDAVLPVVLSGEIPPDEQADSAQDDEALSAAEWKTIATHGQEAGLLAKLIAEKIAPVLVNLYDLAGRWHDAGKAHPAFQGSICADNKPDFILAKAPKKAWLRGRKLYPMPDGSRRPGFRHELASTLALFAVLQRYAPDHLALLGPWREFLNRAGFSVIPIDPEHSCVQPNALETEILALDATQFDLLAYLICAHHGKVRLAWHACPADQAVNDGFARIRGIRDGDTLPAFPLFSADGKSYELAELSLGLAAAAAGLNPQTGKGWTERVLGLLQHYGPFTLAWLEAILRAADQRASKLIAADPLLVNHDKEVQA
jgi:CRISPR-associated endonuclease/helicase Cas3